MDYIKIQNEIMKNNVKTSNNSKYFYHRNEKSIDITEGHFVIRIPDCMFYLNVEKAFSKPESNLSIDALSKDASPIKDTYKSIPFEKTSLHVFETSSGENIYVDEKLLSNFKPDKYDNLTYCGISAKAPIFIYNDNELTGCICPVNYKG